MKKNNIAAQAAPKVKKGVLLNLPDILLGELRKEAEDECRTLEQQIIYVLKNRSKSNEFGIGLYDIKYVPCVSQEGRNTTSFPQDWNGFPKITC